MGECRPHVVRDLNLVRGVNLGSRPEQFRDLTAPLDWPGVCDDALRKALAVVHKRDRVTRRLAEARERRASAQERESVIRHARSRAERQTPQMTSWPQSSTLWTIQYSPWTAAGPFSSPGSTSHDRVFLAGASASLPAPGPAAEVARGARSGGDPAADPIGARGPRIRVSRRIPGTGYGLRLTHGGLTVL